MSMLLLTRMLEQLLQQEVRPFGPFVLNHGGQSVHPLTGFLTIYIRARCDRKRSLVLLTCGLLCFG